MTARAALFSLCVALATCSHGASGTLEGVVYTLPLDGAYRRTDVPRWHDQLWSSDGAGAPIVDVHVGAASAAEGEAPRCIAGGGLGTGDALVFYPDDLERPRNGRTASVRACSPSHPTVVVTCSVYFRDGRMDAARAEASIAPCRGMKLE